MKKLNLTIQCLAVYNSSIEVPDELSLDEAIEYAKEHLEDAPLGKLEWVHGSDQLDEENCDFEEEKIVDATFVSVWDGGYAVETNCKVNLQTREVFDIEVSENAADFVNELDEEFIRFSNGAEFTVGQNSAECDFWYGNEDIIEMNSPYAVFMSDKASLSSQIKSVESRAGSQQRICSEHLKSPER